MNHVAKAKDFHHADNWSQVLRYSDLALTKLKKLTKDRPLEGISDALSMKSDACCFMNRMKEALEYSTERYQLWALARGPAHPDTIDAAFQLIQSLMHTRDYANAEKCAYNLWDILNTNNHEDNRIPADKLQDYLARGAMEYARATLALAQVGGIPPAEKQKSGEEAIVLARRSLAIRIELDRTESSEVAASMLTLTQVLQYFNGVDDEVLRLYQQSIAIHTREEGRSSYNVAVGEFNLGNAYYLQATTVPTMFTTNDMDVCVANWERALSRYRDAAQIFTAIGHREMAVKAREKAIECEQRNRAQKERIAAIKSSKNFKG